MRFERHQRLPLAQIELIYFYAGVAVKPFIKVFAIAATIYNKPALCEQLISTLTRRFELWLLCTLYLGLLNTYAKDLADEVLT